MSDNEQEEEQKPVDGQMSIKVASSDGQEVFFKIKSTTKFAKLKNAYAQRVGKPVETIRFVSDGNRVQDDDTPDTLGLEDGDSIDVILEQIGGASSSRP